MSKLTFLSENHVMNDSTTFTVSSGTENAQFPITNLQKLPTTKVFRSAGNTVTLVIDLGQTRTVDTIAIVGHQITGLKLSGISIRRSNTPVFTSSPVYNLSLSAINNFGYSYIDEISSRYWEITLTGNGSFAELSNIFIGQRVEFDNNALDTTSFKYSTVDNSTIARNKYGSSFINRYNRYKTLSGNMLLMNKEEFKVIRDLTIYHGLHTPVWCLLDTSNILDDEGEFLFSGYFYFESNIENYSQSAHRLFDVEISLREVV